MYEVRVSKMVLKSLRKMPLEIRNAFDAWKEAAERSGPSGLLAIRGYRDHSLKGEWLGARSSSLNNQWRVIYYVEGKKLLILVLLITPHDYRRKL